MQGVQGPGDGAGLTWAAPQEGQPSYFDLRDFEEVPRTYIYLPNVKIRNR